MVDREIVGREEMVRHLGIEGLEILLEAANRLTAEPDLRQPV